MLTSFPQLTLPARFFDNYPAVWLDEARPSPKYVFKNNMNLTSSKIGPVLTLCNFCWSHLIKLPLIRSTFWVAFASFGSDETLLMVTTQSWRLSKCRFTSDNVSKVLDRHSAHKVLRAENFRTLLESDLVALMTWIKFLPRSFAALINDGWKKVSRIK